MTSGPPATLRQALRRMGLSARAFAKSVGLSPSFISMVLRGERVLRGKRALKVAKLTGVPVEKLITPARKPAKRKPPTPLATLRTLALQAVDDDDKDDDDADDRRDTKPRNALAY